MHRALLPVFLLALPAAADEPPPVLVEATETAAALCQAAGGTPRILPGYDAAHDLNGDGRPDFVTDLARLECAGAWDALCTGSGCPVSVWLSAPDGRHDRFDLGPLRGVRFVEGDGLPGLVALYDVANCGQDATADCTRTWRFTSNAPDTPPVDAPAVNAPSVDAPPGADPAPAEAAAPAPALTGWTLRRVPGASPVALGAGVGDIASLGAFCLEGEPFLAVTFHERPPDERVTLGFAFSQGDIDAEAGFESTAGGAYVVALRDTALASRLAGRDREVAVSVDGTAEGILSLSGSTKSLRGALADCYSF